MNLSRLMFISSLVSMAGMGPKLMDLSSAMQAVPSQESGAGGTADFMRRLQEAQVQLATGNTAQPVGDAQLQHLMGGLASTEASAAESAQFANDLRAATGAGGITTQMPVLQKLTRDLEKFQARKGAAVNQAWSAWIGIRALYEEWSPVVRPWLWRVPILLSLAALGCYAVGRFSTARSLCETGYGLSLPWLTVLAWAAAGVALFTRSNPWPIIPTELLLPPLLWMGASAGIMRLVDLNYPVWNSLVKGATAPLASMAVCLVLPHLLGFLPF